MSRSSIQSRGRLLFASLKFLLISLFASALWHTTASAAPRNFLMALWGTSDRVYTDLSWFWVTEAQPSGTSILRLDGYYQDPAGLASLLTNSNLDWSKIAAVWIDEPYLTAISDSGNNNAGAADPCGLIYTQLSKNTRNQVEAAAQTVHNLSPKTRVWVNFSVPEMKWMMNNYCPFALNGPYIDVISIDYYAGPFSDIRHYYDWLKAYPATPYQQRAMVPLVGSKLSPNPISPETSAARLLAYFEYATQENQVCDLPVRANGPIGLNDTCPVWAIGGWPGVDYTVDTYVGFFDPTSAPIRDAWHTQRQLMRSDRVAPVLGSLDVLFEN